MDFNNGHINETVARLCLNNDDNDSTAISTFVANPDYLYHVEKIHIKLIALKKLLKPSSLSSPYLNHLHQQLLSQRAYYHAQQAEQRIKNLIMIPHPYTNIILDIVDATKNINYHSISLKPAESIEEKLESTLILCQALININSTVTSTNPLNQPVIISGDLNYATYLYEASGISKQTCCLL